MTLASPTPRRAAALVLAFGLGAAPANAKGNMESIADLAASVTDAVVNISAAQVTEERSPDTPPKAAPGAPLDDLFQDFFKRQLGRKGEGGGEDAPHGRRANSLGSGFIVDPSGIVITNNHVIDGANDITVILTDGTKLKAEVVGKDSKIDVAVLQVKPAHPLPSVPFGDSDGMRVGDPVMAVGNPFGLGGTVTAGIVSARNRNIDNGPYDNYLQTDAAINKGNSGGPLFDMKGEVIGINTAILSPSGGSIGLGFATPSDTVVPIIAQLREFHEVRRGWLGVRVQPVTAEIAEALKLGTPRGALVAGVDENGPAAAGLKQGDVIVAFDGHDVHDSHDLPKFVASAPVGKEVAVSILRDGKPQDVPVKLGRLDAPAQKASLGGTAPADVPKPAVQQFYGLGLVPLDDAFRKQYGVKDSVKGVAVTAVDAGSPAADRLKPGDVVVEVNQVGVADPADVAGKIKAQKDAGKRTALLLVSNPQGDTRYVALAVN